jgi:HEAT repeat protein
MWKMTMNRSLFVAALCVLPASWAPGQDRPASEPARSVIEDLRAGNVDVRRAAASRLRESDRGVQREALPILIDLLLTEKDGQVRLAVLDTVTTLGPDAAPAIPALVHTLKTDYGGQGKEELHQDYRSALALAAIGKPAVEGLRGLLGARKENVKAEVVMALGRIGPDAGSAIPDLLPLLGDKIDRIRMEASLALGRIGAAGPLIAASEHQDPAIRAQAVEGLGHLPAPDGQVQSVVLKCATDVDARVRAAAVKSLTRLPSSDEARLSVLGERLRDGDEQVRLAAVDGLVERPMILARLGSELESLLTAEDDQVARHAAFLLGKAGPDAAPRLLNALRQETSRIGTIAEALAQIGRPAVGPLTQALKAPEPRVRQGAALALGQIRPLLPGTVAKLTAGLDDPDREVKGAFLGAIGYLGPRAGESVPAIRALLRDGSPEIRVQAVEILSQSAPRDDLLLGDLIALLDDPDPRVQRRAIEALRALGPPARKALAVVIGKLKSPATEVRLAAAEWIASQGQAATEAVPALGALLADPTPRLRTTAAQSLGKLGKAAQPAVDRLASLLGDEAIEVREAATVALGSLELDGDVLRPHLARALQDEKPEVRRAALSAIQRLGPQGAIFLPDMILLASDQENSRSIERSLRRFERLGPDPRSIPELVKQLDHKQESVRLLAVKFLGLAGGSARDAIPALERMRDDPNSEVRKQVEAARERIMKGRTSG